MDRNNWKLSSSYFFPHYVVFGFFCFPVLMYLWEEQMSRPHGLDAWHKASKVETADCEKKGWTGTSRRLENILKYLKSQWHFVIFCCVWRSWKSWKYILLMGQETQFFSLIQILRLKSESSSFNFHQSTILSGATVDAEWSQWPMPAEKSPWKTSIEWIYQIHLSLKLQGIYNIYICIMKFKVIQSN